MSSSPTAHSPLLNPTPNASISSVAVGIGLFSTTMFGALQALVLVAVIGNGYETDAFLAAYSLYYAVVIVAASVRAPFVTGLGALTSDAELKGAASALISRSVTISVALGAVLLIVAPIAGAMIAYGGGRPSQEIAVVSLLILVPAGMMQIYATSAAAILNSARRFVYSASIYAVSSFVAIVMSLIFLELLGVLGAPLGMLTGAVILAFGHWRYVRRFTIQASPRVTQLREPATRRLSIEIVANASLGLAIQLGLAVALAAVGRIGRDGLVTDYSYGYFIVLATTGFSSIALNTVILPDVVSEATARGLAGARDRIVGVAPFSFGAVVPVIAALLTFGEPFLEWIAAPLLEPADIAIVFDVAAIFSLAAIGMILLQNGSTAVISMGRWGMLGLAAVLTFGAQSAAVLIASSHSLIAVAWAQSAVVAIAAILLMTALFRDQAAAVIFGSLQPLLRLVPCAFGFVAFRIVLGSDPSVPATLGALAVSTVIYLGLAIAWVPSIRDAIGALARRPS